MFGQNLQHISHCLTLTESICPTTDSVGADRAARAGGRAIPLASDGPHDHVEAQSGRQIHPSREHARTLILRP